MDTAALKTATLDECVDRFNLFRDEVFEKEEAWYSMRAEENHLLFGCFDDRRPRMCKETEEKRYFKCFYDSFKHREDRFYKSLLVKVIEKESAERVILNEHEHEEFYAICRHAGDILGVPEWSRFHCTSLPVPEAEDRGRRIIKGEYFAMFLEAVSILEVLHRRTIMFSEEPVARNIIAGAEVHDWIESRRQQVERERLEELAADAKERQRRLAYHNWKRQQAYQVFLFEQSEQEERMDTERLQRLHAGILAQAFHAEHKEARYQQLRYEMRQRQVPVECSRDLMAKEATERSAVMLLQRDYFRTLQAEEVKSFLWTRRNMMMNHVMDRERGGGEYVYTFM
ncbi:hypothetical protein DQ04_02291100 [Trypanosoma grayi]|uniref:hypothetical protein n=1 Tax=Trypanosoma grayi TaxID=71804 RepID=UPI0004F45C88|nr:hypothetical protein DQ04_02291100 [Trypanosoma grayi]KEG11780.1 hypothetical protein DQ04_02291100 [Trypanosoma grayi]